MCLYLSHKLRRRIFQETVASQETSSQGSCNSCSVFLGLRFLKGKENSVKNVKQGQRYKYILKALNKTCLKAVQYRDFSAPGAKQTSSSAHEHVPPGCQSAWPLGQEAQLPPWCVLVCERWRKQVSPLQMLHPGMGCLQTSVLHPPPVERHKKIHG